MTTNEVTPESTDDLTALAERLSRSGKTYAQIAQVFVTEGVPGEWDRASVERLMRGEGKGGPSIAAHVSPAGEHHAAVPPETDVLRHRLEAIDRNTRTTAFWMQVVGWIVLVWAITSVAVGIWIGVEVAAAEQELQNESPSAYSACLADESTTMEDCEGLDGDPGY